MSPEVRRMLARLKFDLNFNSLTHSQFKYIDQFVRDLTVLRA
jgi:hypothetical protein